MDEDKEKRHKSSGSGKSPTKFMERPGSKPEKKKDEEIEQSHPEFINDDLDALETQERDEDIDPSTGWNPPKPRSDQKPEQRKFQDPEKRDSRSDDAGDCACP
jgi:hypothetical protein